MATKGEIKVLARLTACEQIIQHLLLMAANNSDDPIRELKAYRKRVLEAAKDATVSGVDPAMSDHLSAELEQCLDDLLSDLIQKASSKGSRAGERRG